MHLAEDLLFNIHTYTEQLESADMKVLRSLLELLEEVDKSKRGLIEPDQPLGIPWSLFKGEILTYLRSIYLPNKLFQYLDIET
jgi:hypothetical protein